MDFLDLPSYARTRTATFPKWKVHFIRSNRSWLSSIEMNCQQIGLMGYTISRRLCASLSGTAKVKKGIFGDTSSSSGHLASE